jgi:hypothetical protein
MKIGSATPEDIAQMTAEVIDFTRTRTTEPATAYAAMLTGGLKLAVPDLGEPRAMVMMVHLFGDMIDLGRQMLDAGLVEPFSDDQPDAGRGPQAA